ncbi:MAG: NAD(P)-binding protein, partial [Candidatus Binatia bacterium]
MGRKKIAVIGGGVGAITTVYAMTRDPSWRERYEITVYQLGWRLGGKGASGRNLAAGARIQEHGLHVWAGFYDNAFRCIRGCYEDLVSLGLRRPTDPLGAWDKAFKPLRHLFLSERLARDGEPAAWKPWLIELPANGLEPGTATSAPSPFEIFLQIAADFASFLENGPLAERAKAHLGAADAARLTGAHAAIHGHLRSLPRDPRRHDGEQTSVLADLIRAG